MKTITNPSELKWNDSPLPSADAIHPDCRLIIFSARSVDSIEYSLLGPYNHVDMINFWIDQSGRMYGPSKYKATNYHWAWYVRF